MYERLNKIKKDSVLIATRELEFSVKGGKDRLPLQIDIYSPVQLKPAHGVAFVDLGFYGCVVEFSSIGVSYVVYGIDSIEALEFAANVNPILIGHRHQYDFFSPGEEHDHLDYLMFQSTSVFDKRK